MIIINCIVFKSHHFLKKRTGLSFDLLAKRTNQREESWLGNEFSRWGIVVHHRCNKKSICEFKFSDQLKQCKIYYFNCAVPLFIDQQRRGPTVENNIFYGTTSSFCCWVLRNMSVCRFNEDGWSISLQSFSPTRSFGGCNHNVTIFPVFCLSGQCK